MRINYVEPLERLDGDPQECKEPWADPGPFPRPPRGQIPPQGDLPGTSGIRFYLSLVPEQVLAEAWEPHHF